MRAFIIILFLANLLAGAAVFGVFGPLPAAGPLEPQRLEHEMHPEWLHARPATASEAEDRAVVGGPAVVDGVRSAPLSK